MSHIIGKRHGTLRMRKCPHFGAEPDREDLIHVANAHSYRTLLPLAAITAFSLAISGCAVGPDYIPPKENFAALHNYASTGTRTVIPSAPPLDSWWTGFGDPILVAVVQNALAQNLDLAASFARVEQASAAASGAGAALLPSVNFDANGTAQHQSLVGPLGSIARTFPGYSRDQKEYSVGAAASWEIDVAGGLRRNAAAARAELAAAQADGMGTRITVAADAADAYLQIRGFQARLTVTLDQIETDAKLLKLVQVRRHLGDADDREVAQADALLKQARATVPSLRIGLEAQLNRLDVLMGAQPGTYALELNKPAAIPSVPSIDDSEQPLDFLRRRPDVIAAERRLAASNERIGLALSDYYPKISLSGALGFDSSGTHDLFTARAFQPLGSGTLRWRLFDFGKVRAEVAQARGAYAEALANYQLTALKASEDVENAFMSLSQTVIRRQALEGEVIALTRARDLSHNAYKAGSITLTDVLDANRQLLIARSELDASSTDAARAAVSTFRALGGGWEINSNLKMAASTRHAEAGEHSE